jgi:hypothetical protein
VEVPGGSYWHSNQAPHRVYPRPPPASFPSSPLPPHHHRRHFHLFSRFFLRFLFLGPRLQFRRLPSIGHLSQLLSSCMWCRCDSSNSSSSQQ